MSFIYRSMLKRIGLAPTHPVRIQRNVKVRMPDGAELLTDVFLGSAEARAPAIVVRSPYGKGAFIAGNTAYPLASQGFNVVLQCCRGTHGSSGIFDPHHDEQRDGLATIEWAKQQPWCDGTIATCGGSYLGYTQWAIASGAGPEVKAMALQVTLSDFSSMTYAGGSLMLQNALTWTYTMTMGKRRGALLRMLLARMLRRPTITDEQWRLLPLRRIDHALTGETVPFWQDWMTHASSHDPWWQPMSHRSAIARIKWPVTMVAGWFDIFTPWQMQDFKSLRDGGCDVRITVGPWQHTDPALIRVGLEDALELFGRQLLGKRADAPRKAVKLYVMQANEWREFDAWPPRETLAERWYLQPERRLRQAAPLHAATDRYRYDPADPTPSIGGPALESSNPSVDNRVLEERADVLTYTSEPLASPCDVIGTVAADLHVSSSARSADFFVRLCDVDANGVSRNICDGLQRVTFDDAGEPRQIRFELWPTAYRIAAGHRLRVQVSSGAFPRWARNLGTTEPIADGAELHAAVQTIHLSPTHPSSILLPVCPQH